MKLETPNLDVQTTGIKKKSKFSIAATGKAFKVLSSGLYSNKIKAIIRELSCNAYDSHVEAGCKDKPFEVHIPTSNLPVFYVRDFGVGLKPKEVETLYTTYFQSTKTESNDVIGCLGLGSKSPFSYTESFTVTTWIDGMAHSYACHLDQIGEPTISHIYSDYSDEPTGLKVEFAVKQRDFYSFINEAENVFKHFSIKPDFVGEFINIPTTKYMCKGEGWKIPHNNDYYNRKTPTAIMGNVAYPIDTAKIISYEDTDGLVTDAGFMSSLLNNGIELYFEIGELNVVASREGLEYFDSTIKNIIKKFPKIKEEISEEISKEFKDCKSLWETRRKVHDLARGKYKFLSSEIRSDFAKWNGEFVNETVELSHYMRDTNELVIVSLFYPKTDWYGKVRVSKDDDVYSICADKEEKKFVFINDPNFKKPYTTKCREYIRENPNLKIYTIRYKDGYDALAFINLLGLTEDQIEYAEDLFPKRKAKKKGTTSVSTSSPIPLLKWNGCSNYDNPSHNWLDLNKVDISTLDGYYVEVNRFTPVMDDKKSRANFVKISNIKKHVEYLTGKQISKIYGVRGSHKSKVKKNKNLVNLFDYGKEILKQSLQDPRLKHAGSTKTASEYSGLINVLIDILPPTHDVVKHYKLCKEIRSYSTFIDSVRMLAKIFDEAPLKEDKDILKEERKRILSKYPLLFEMTYYSNKEAIKEYVELIDNK